MAEFECRTITQVTKIFTFDAAHILEHHKGKCNKLHGHTYKLEVTVQGVPRSADGTPSEGMVIDFGVLKRIVKTTVIDRYDHSMLNEHSEFQVTTAEVMARVIFHALSYSLDAFYETSDLTDWSRLPSINDGPANLMTPPPTLSQARLYSVKLWETPTSYAEVIRV